ncbi:MAG: hypothetical protein ABI597_03440 [Gammaproteobacteria bacterium]
MHGVIANEFAIAKKKTNTIVYLVAAFFSIILAIWAAAKTSIINPDAICYLQSAATMSDGLSAATHVCNQANWPFYSMCIYALSQMTHLSYLSAANCLDGFFSLISVITFIAIVRTLTTSARIVGLAAVVILLAHDFNEIRVDVIRDHGYWAFYLLSLFFFLRFFQRYRFHTAILWSVTLIAATMFRIEGAIFLLLLPMAVLFDVRNHLSVRVKAFFQLNALPIFATLGVITWLIVNPLQQLGRLSEVQYQLVHGIGELVKRFTMAKDALALHVLSPFALHEAPIILVVMLIGWYVVNVISNLSIGYAGLVIYGWWKKTAKWNFETRLVMGSYIFVNVFITAIFLVDNLFLAKRYLIGLSLVLMLWVPFACESLLTQWKSRKWPVLLAAIFMLTYGLGGIVDFGYSKKYIRDAGDWLAVNTALDAKIYSNDYQLLYYANHLGNDIFSKGHEYEKLKAIDEGRWKQFDYLALRSRKKNSVNDESILKQITWAPIKVFENTHGDQVRVYQVKTKVKVKMNGGSL